MTLHKPVCLSSSLPSFSLRATTTVKANLWRPASPLTRSLSWSVGRTKLALCVVSGSLHLCATVFFHAGSEDGRVHMWSTESGMKVAVLDGKHQGPISSLQFNPRNMMFASACTNMVRTDARQHTVAFCCTANAHWEFLLSFQTFWLPCIDDL